MLIIREGRGLLSSVNQENEMRTNKTITDKDGNQRWNPKAQCPAHDNMTCEQARADGVCQGGNPDRELTCLTFICVQCCQVRPYEYGAADAHPSCCDDCAAALRGEQPEPEPELRFT